jgi:hypothetical protein
MSRRDPIFYRAAPSALNISTFRFQRFGLFTASRNRLLSRRDRHKNSVTDPRESDQGQKKREKKNCFVKVVRQPKHMEHEAQRGNVQNKREQRRIGPGPGDNPGHEQNKKENRGQGQAPNYLEENQSRSGADYEWRKYA